MVVQRLKGWRAASTALAVGLAACGGEAGESNGAAGESGAEAPVLPPAVTATGGEAGEAGAAGAYVGVSGSQLAAQRLQHLKGFLLVAERMAETGAVEDAAVLVQQGVLEVYDPATAEFGVFDIAPVRAAAQNGAETAAARRTVDSALSALDFDHAALAARMVDIATGLYSGVVQADFVDPIEYQHSLGAALAARDALVSGEAALRAADGAAYAEALAQLDRFIALWPQTTAPDAPASYRQVLVQGSRVRFALSPFL